MVKQHLTKHKQNMKSIYIYTTLLLVTFSSQAQNPAPSDSIRRILFIGAKAHLGNGEVIEQSAIGRHTLFLADDFDLHPVAFAFGHLCIEFLLV